MGLRTWLTHHAVRWLKAPAQRETLEDLALAQLDTLLRDKRLLVSKTLVDAELHDMSNVILYSCTLQNCHVEGNLTMRGAYSSVVSCNFLHDRDTLEGPTPGLDTGRDECHVAVQVSPV